MNALEIQVYVTRFHFSIYLSSVCEGTTKPITLMCRIKRSHEIPLAQGKLPLINPPKPFIRNYLISTKVKNRYLGWKLCNNSYVASFTLVALEIDELY